MLNLQFRNRLPMERLVEMRVRQNGNRLNSNEHPHAPCHFKGFRSLRPLFAFQKREAAQSKTIVLNRLVLRVRLT